jgi:hypothetical protein
MAGPDPTESLLDSAESASAEPFRKRAALVVAVLATLLAVAGLGGENAQQDMTTANILASNAYAFFQAKNIRQTDNLLAADELESLLATTNPNEAARQAIVQRIDRYRATAARYESEPETGEGKVELLERARGLEQQRDVAAERNKSFDYATVLLQIGIVLASVAILAVSRPLLLGSMALGAVATLLLVNGFFSFAPVPG